MKRSGPLAIAIPCLAILSCFVATFFRDSTHTVVIDRVQLENPQPGHWVWPLDEKLLALERFAVADTLTSIVFLGERIIPLQSVHVRWPASAVPWHEIADGKLHLYLDDVRESQLEQQRLSITIMGAYSRVRVAGGIICFACAIACSIFFPIPCLAFLHKLLDRAPRIAAALGGLLVLFVLAIRFGWMQCVAEQETVMVPEGFAAWYAPFFWCLRRLESAGPGLFFLLGLMAAVACRCTPLQWSLHRSLQRTAMKRSYWIAAACLCMTALIGGWVGAGVRYLPDLTHYTNPLQGRLVWGDAADYFQGVQSLLTHAELTGFNQRRPINACLQAVRYGLCGGDRQLSMLVELTAFAASLGLLTNMVARRFGVASALVSFGLIWGFSRWYAASNLSELLGLTLGCWSAAVILTIHHGHGQSLRLNRHGVRLALMALSIATVAQTARPGALFALPLVGGTIAILAGRSNSSSWIRAIFSTRALVTLGVAAMIVFLGLSTTKGLNAFYGDGQNQPGANFAHTLAGLSEGRRWSETMEAHQAEIAPLKTEGEVSSFLYSLAIENIVKRPSVMFGEFSRAWYYFMRELPGAMGQSVFPELGRLNGVKLAILAMIVFACVRVARFSNRSPVALLIAFLIGILLSVPIVFLDGKWRCLGATWPVLTVLISIAIASNRNRHRKRLGPPIRSDWLAQRRGQSGSIVSRHAYALGCIILIAFFGPGALHRLWRDTSPSENLSGDRVRLGEELKLKHTLFPDAWIHVRKHHGNDHQAMDRQAWQVCMQESNVENLPEVLRVVDQCDDFAMTQRFDPQRNRLWWLVVPVPYNTIISDVQTEGQFQVFALPNLLILQEAKR